MITIIDNGDTGYSEVGTGWASDVGGYAGDFGYHAAGDGTHKARWDFTGLTGGTAYAIGFHWPQGQNRATNTPWRIYDSDNTTILASGRINQEQAQIDFGYGPDAWAYLGAMTPSGTSLRVEINDDADEYIISDAVLLSDIPLVVATPPYPAVMQYSAATASVTLAAPAGTIHYTTGSVASPPADPNAGSAAYGSPLSIAPGTVLKAVDVVGGTAGPIVTRTYFDGLIFPGQTWYDTSSGRPIQCGGGGIYTLGPTYYLYGTQQQVGGKEIAVRLFSSVDLLNWGFVGTLLTAADFAALDATITWISRPSIVFCTTTGKFVMWVHATDDTLTQCKVGVATADAITGPWTVQSVGRPGGRFSSDMTLTVGPDGTCYFVYSGGVSANAALNIRILAANYLSVAGFEVQISAAPREGMALFWNDATHWFLQHSGLTGWSPNQNQYQFASDPLGSWSAAANPFQFSGSEDWNTAYHSQTKRFFRTRTGQLVYLGDRWDPAQTDFTRSTQVWLPATNPTADTLSIAWQDSWAPDAGSAGGLLFRRRKAVAA